MAGSGGLTQLYVARDDTKLIVALYPLTIRGGKADRRDWGNVTELTPAAPIRTDVAVRQGKLGLGLVGVLSAALCCMNVRWWIVVPAAITLSIAIIASQYQSHAAGVAAAPEAGRRPHEHRVLTASEERAAFQDSLAIAKRIHATWPALQGLVDTTDVAPTLSRALWDLAGVLSRREEIRKVRDELKRHSNHGLTVDSPAVQDLLGQLGRVDRLWSEINAEVQGHIANLTATALAGESFIREQEIRRAAREAEQAITNLVSPDLPGSPDAGEQLADHTAAVLKAYRELTEQYGGAA